MSKPTRTPATAENCKWLRVHLQKFLTPHQTPKEKRRILPESTPALRIRGHLWCRPFWHTKNWVIGFSVSITVRTPSALVVIFFRLLEPLSYVRFDLVKSMQVSLLLIERYPDYFEKKKTTST